MNEEIKCVACNATFKSAEYLNEDDKCDMCVKLGIRTKEEKKQDPDEKENEGRLKNVVQKLIDDSLKSYGILQCCECGKYFFRRSPAQKTCGECKTN